MNNKKNNVIQIPLKIKKSSKGRKLLSFLTRNAIVILSICFIGYIAYSLFLPVIKTDDINREIARIEEEIKRAELKKDELEGKIELLETDTYVERMAREKLGLIKPGETLIMPSEPGIENELETEKPLY